MNSVVLQKTKNEKLKKFYDRFGNLILAAISFLVIIYVLFYGSDVGLSDNADFGRVMKASSLEYIKADKAFIYVEKYAVRFQGSSSGERIANLLFGSENLSYYPSIQLLFVRTSVLLNVAINIIMGSDPGVYRLSALGSLYSAIYAVLLYALFMEIRINNRIMDLTGKILILVVLCDIGYLAYFNSFYGEAVQLLAYLLIVICLLRISRNKRLSLPDILLSFCAVVTFGWSKFINIPIAILFAFVMCYMAFHKANRKLLLASCTISVCVLSCIYFCIPKWIDHETDYNAVFLGIVKEMDAEMASKALQELELPQEMVSFSGTGSYTSKISQNNNFKEAFKRISKTTILKFYLRHPALFAKKISISIRHSGFVRPYYLSNYGNSSIRFTLSGKFSFWSSLRAQLGFDTIYGNAAIILAFAAALVCLVQKRYIKKTQSLMILILAAAMLSYSLAVPFITNGEGDLAKHMFAYVQTIDYIFLFVILCTLDSLSFVKLSFMPLTALIMAAALCASPIKSLTTDRFLKNKIHDRIEAGSYLTLGKSEGKNLIWLVSDVKGGIATLIAADPVCELPFYDDGSKYGNNYWTESSIRHWLNNDFLYCFNESERALILESRHRFLLSLDYKKYAESGESDFNCTHIPQLADRGYERAIGAQTTDRVFLPDISSISSICKSRRRIMKNIAYWLDTPYYNNGSMLRCVFPDGYIYFRDAKDACGVVPVTRIRAELPVKGNGSLNYPFYMDEIKQ